MHLLRWGFDHRTSTLALGAFMASVASGCGDSETGSQNPQVVASATMTSAAAPSVSAPASQTSQPSASAPAVTSAMPTSGAPSATMPMASTAPSAIASSAQPNPSQSAAPSASAPPQGSTAPSTSAMPPEPSASAMMPGMSMPSPGCNGGNSSAQVPSSVVDKPMGYDGTTPVPVLFAFHGAGGNSSSLMGNFSNDAKSRGYLGVYLKSTGSQWSPRDDNAVVDAAYDAVTQNYCVDMNRFFAVGHSSGAQMITQMLCGGEDRFRAVAPVASSKYCNGWNPTAAIVIHGTDDIERGGQGEMRYGLNDGDGHIDFGVYHDSNECTDANTAFDPGGNCAASIHPGCVEYNECAARTVFCNHDDPSYGTSNHGVPCFASKVMFDFFDEFQ